MKNSKSAIWHPYTQHQLAPPPLEVSSAKGCVLHLANGKELIDGISSWWVNSYGHANKTIADAVYQQMLNLDQVIFAGFTHQPALQLANKLLQILPANQTKVFFSDNGSTAVEVALKMAIQFHFNRGHSDRKSVVCFKNSYHGDTFGAMAIGERGKFFTAFEPYLFDVIQIDTPVSVHDEVLLQIFEQILVEKKPCAFIFEPLVQGAAGMQIHSPAGLSAMITLAKKHGVLTIADEVMTGFGRTGKHFASDYLTENPDIFCLSKCLTAGVMPMGLTTCTQEIFDAFCSEDQNATLYHGHSYTGNPVACAAALAGLDLLESEEIQHCIHRITLLHGAFAGKIKSHPRLRRVQTLGTILSLELETGEGNNYFSFKRNEIYQFFLDRGILLRPLGNVIYILPPFIITEDQLNTIYEAIIELLNSEELNS